MELIIKPNTDTFGRIKSMLEEGKTLYFHYGLMGCGDKLSITPSGKLGFTDMLNRRCYLTQKEFNRYNAECDFYQIIAQEEQ